MITKVRLQNWKSHLDSEFVFSKGVNALAGIMGSGKSSVMDAVCFGLFGSFPALQGKKVLLDGLVMSEPQERGSAVVELEFAAGGKKYLVKRVIQKGKGSEAELREDGEIKEVSSRGVTREVERVLGMDYDIFSRAVYSEQNGLDYFLKIPAGRRREHLDRMLRLDRYEKARLEAVALQNRLKGGREEKLRVTADLEKEGLEGQIAGLDKELGELKQKLKFLEEERGLLEKKVGELEEQVAGQEEAEKELHDVFRRLEGLKGGLEEIRTREGKSRKIVRGRDLGNIDAEVAKLEAGIEERREAADSLKEELHSSKERERLTAEQLEGIEQLESSCPLCESEISKEKKAGLAKARKKTIQRLGEDIARKHSALFGIGADLERMEHMLGEKRVERERVSQAFKEIMELEDKLQEIMKVKGVYEKNIAGLEQKIAGKDISKAREELQEVVGRSREVVVECRELEARLSEKEESRGALVSRQELLEKYRKELEKEELVSSQLEGFGQALKATQEELRKVFLQNVNSIMERIWQELYPYGDFESVRLAVVGGDYVLQLKRREWVDAEGSVSGGERSLACLALRVAFSLAFLPDLKWLILDEPTHNLDSNTVRQLSEVLREKLPGFAEQVFIITHDPVLSEGMGTVYQLERNKAAGEPTRIASG